LFIRSLFIIIIDKSIKENFDTFCSRLICHASQIDKANMIYVLTMFPAHYLTCRLRQRARSYCSVPTAQLINLGIK